MRLASPPSTKAFWQESEKAIRRTWNGSCGRTGTRSRPDLRDKRFEPIAPLMLRMMSDNDVQGHVSRLMDICQASPWADLWQGLECALCTFKDLDLASNASDAAVWQARQDNAVLLITGNRNAEDPESLEITIRQRNRPDCLPVLTLADPDRISRDRAYAESVVERLFDVLIDIEVLRGTGRIFLP